MSDGVKRTVRLGAMSYINSAGQVRWADCGAEVEVHPDHVERFDRLNVLQGEHDAPARVDTPPEVQAGPVEPVKRRPGRPRKSTED